MSDLEIKEIKNMNAGKNCLKSYEIIFSEPETPRSTKSEVFSRLTPVTSDSSSFCQNTEELNRKHDAAAYRREKLLNGIRARALEFGSKALEVKKKKECIDENFRKSAEEASRNKSENFSRKRNDILREVVDKASTFNKSVEKVRKNINLSKNSSQSESFDFSSSNKEN